MKKLLIILGVIIVGIVLFVIFKKDSVDKENFSIGQANVASVSTSFEESFPLGVRVSVKGDLPDACTILGDIQQERDAKGDFLVTIETKRPLDAVCSQVTTPFETSFVLGETTGLTKGKYNVIVNGVQTSFIFEVDNFVSNVDSLK